ncbi:hypothetical protein DSM106972_001940 [Dulcicalothrix desertica PCC 7102]|uniref:Uncharacterized protein n=1 Tax=Dulcicalothrix desertica PCC 7102 TaxID=232991 RepID=A0A433VUD9_9CYAN|nr:hypothetical protein DSM106972_001940 [Dulcicalothrix desertica PCC 7102]TWH50897.1 hypothetical protein CAL7102_05244 [Dulcicalothrix desertica PCC 7102]
MITIETRQLANIATWMVPVKSTDLPTVLKGVFFMDGNPLPDHCITMYNLEWDKENLVLFLPVFAPLQWTFHKSIPGWLLLIGAQISRFSYKIQFEDKTLQRAQVTPLSFGITIPKWLVNATMYQDTNSNNGDTWQRKNLWFGGTVRIGEYTLRRVVDENGCYTNAFQDMLTKVKSECLVILP